jgi:malate synthase
MMTSHELEALMQEALRTIAEMDERERKIALNSGVLDRMFERMHQSTPPPQQHSPSSTAEKLAS